VSDVRKYRALRDEVIVGHYGAGGEARSEIAKNQIYYWFEWVVMMRPDLFEEVHS